MANAEDVEKLKRRMFQFGLRVVRLTQALPSGRVAGAIGYQLLRAGTSAGANYRAACRARSSADFVSKMGIVEEELDESQYWMEMLIAAGLVKAEKLESLMCEGEELLRIAVASIRTARHNRRSDMPTRRKKDSNE